ncbi:BQ2448_4208 [Microbotryum intermedium]|uniref:BQ2448_4208 protein n=1 Tax=Microbotryum intermedium TaxID=269621 RepID=A0A238FKK1_9BASI|nr:BQ2448_4208 [Microbotryum intermedium]
MPPSYSSDGPSHASTSNTTSTLGLTGQSHSAMSSTSTSTSTSTNASSLAHARSLLTLDAFKQDNFNVARLVESLMEDDVKQAKADGGAFNPQPHIKTLEQALSLLLPLRKANATKTAELEKAVAAAERAYRNDVRGAKAGFETVNTQFQALDSKITNVGRGAVRIGEQLESIDRLRQRASEAHDLILYYNETAMGDTSRLELMRKEGGREGRAKVAVAARRLMSLAKEVEGVDGAEQTRDTIEKYCERFEKDMLKLFDRYYRKGDPKAMAVSSCTGLSSRLGKKSELGLFILLSQHCAKTLQDFNGGQSCIQIYVNQHDFFISKERVQESAGNLVGGAIWELLPDPDALAPRNEPGLNSLYDEIRVTVGQEAQIITAVFPNPPIVMQVFLQRVFAQVIQAYIETLVEMASSSSSLAYLRILHLARSTTNTLVEDLKAHEFFRASSSSLASTNATATTPVSATFGNQVGDRTSGHGANGMSVVVGAGAVGVAAVSMMLDQAMEELFVPYMEGNRYLDREGKSLTELYAGKLLRFTNWHVSGQAGSGFRTPSRAMNKAKPSNTIFDRMVNQLTAAAHQASQNIVLDRSSLHEHSDPSRLDRLMKLSGLSNLAKDQMKDGEEIHPEQMFEEGDGELDLGVAESMLKWHAEAVGRMVELSVLGDVQVGYNDRIWISAPHRSSPASNLTLRRSKNAFTLLKVLADSFGKAYVETALDTATHQLSSYDAKTEPDLGPMSVCRLADMIMHLWQRYIATALVPLAGTSVTVRREMNIFNNHVSVRIEQKINTIVQRTTDGECFLGLDVKVSTVTLRPSFSNHRPGIVSWLSHLLSKQRKLDFKPRNDNEAFSKINTEPCLLVCDFLVKVRETAVASLSGRNCEIFLTEVGVTFHTLLLEHLKKFPISATGGLMLTKDLALYQDTVASFSLTPLNDRFEMLRQLGNVFIVQPEILKSYLNESYLARIENRLLRPFVMMRTDFGDFKKAFWDNIFGIDENAPGSSSGSVAIEAHGGRASFQGTSGGAGLATSSMGWGGAGSGTNTLLSGKGGEDVLGALKMSDFDLGLDQAPGATGSNNGGQASGGPAPPLPPR